MKKKTYFFLVLAVAAIAAMTGYKFYQKANQTVEDKPVKKIAVAVVHPERRQMLDSREFTGTLRADSSFELSPKVLETLMLPLHHACIWCARPDLNRQLPT